MLASPYRRFACVFQKLCRQVPTSCAMRNEIETKRNFCKFVDLSEVEYEKYSEETLTKLTEFFDALPDIVECDSCYDVSYAMGVLTAHIGADLGTYVINKQTPNRQIWFSSPISGPKRYDYSTPGRWVYKRDGVSLNEALQKELREIYSTEKIVVPN